MTSTPAEREEVAEVIAEPAASPAPAPIAPQKDHPWFRQRTVKLFGKDLKL